MIRTLSHPGAGLPWPRSLMWAMAEVGLTDDELAAAVGISASSLRRYRRGRVPSARNAARLRAFFGWSDDEVPPRVGVRHGLPRGYPNAADHTVRRLLRGVAAAIWDDVSPSRRYPGHRERLRAHRRRLAWPVAL